MHRVAEAIKRIDHVRLDEYAQDARNSADGQEADEQRAEEENHREGKRLDQDPPRRQRPGAGLHARVQHLDQRRHPDEQQTEAPLQQRCE